MRRAFAAGAAAGAALATLRALRDQPPGGRERWARVNYRDRDVDLLGGPAAAVGSVMAATVAGSPGLIGAVGASAALGCYDDLFGVTHARGLRGHLAALRRGELTTGVVKMAGLAAAGLLAAPHRSNPAARLADAALISGTANLVNLLDLRPGRALKVTALLGAPLAVGGGAGPAAAAGAAATAITLLPGDLSEHHMIGDCGANALGALLGWSVTARGNGPTRMFALAAVIGLTLASERMSFSAVIEQHPTLAALDRWGRQPA
jgi:hypothetical protein